MGGQTEIHKEITIFWVNDTHQRTTRKKDKTNTTGD